MFFSSIVMDMGLRLISITIRAVALKPGSLLVEKASYAGFFDQQRCLATVDCQVSPPQRREQRLIADSIPSPRMNHLGQSRHGIIPHVEVISLQVRRAL
ncbi:hypothetical protein A9Q02_04830 [Candidatus Chloroploca asiatica]|uniref:Uncharacterized protein n=1 Tax=Candidatus Chloroploca asiatica TaxID=1506545 RepID=A0A2H3KHH0_9CHLR|nr:hypothetical protein A9Q02_04830 [Candidatus Chloroploca asiatica]